MFRTKVLGMLPPSLYNLTLLLLIAILLPNIKRGERAMKCPECNFENPEDTLYCGKCGIELLSKEEVPASPTKTLETPTEELTRGTTFASRYEIIEELGKGGMADYMLAVYTLRASTCSVKYMNSKATKLKPQSIMKNSLISGKMLTLVFPKLPMPRID
jgi:hypothetical protein